MKILWLGGIVLPRIAEQEHMKVVHINGWLIQLSEMLKDRGIQLVYTFDADRKIEGSTDYYSYYGLLKKKTTHRELGEVYISQAVEILKKEQPDVVHIWGTEYSHTLAMLEACERCRLLEHAVVSIQGLVSYYSYHYSAFLPWRIVAGFTIRDLIKGNVAMGERDFRIQGIIEEKAIQKARHVIGRTEWDSICAKQMNPSVTYHFNNETLRSEFYTGETWSPERCQRHSIFCSQSHYPIKGVHIAIEALRIIKKEFPDAHLYIGGKDHTQLPFYLLSRYGKYLLQLIKKYDLNDNVSFLGFLSADQMKERFLGSNVFLSPASIENSPNSLGEAMILGVPCVASNVGGVHSVFTDRVDGRLYPADEPYILAEYIGEIFRDESLALEYSENAMKHAKMTHDAEKNMNELMEIYRLIG